MLNPRVTHVPSLASIMRADHVTTAFTTDQYAGQWKARSTLGAQDVRFSIDPLTNFLTALKNFRRDQDGLATISQQRRMVPFQFGAACSCTEVWNASGVEDAHQHFTHAITSERLWSAA